MVHDEASSNQGIQSDPLFQILANPSTAAGYLDPLASVAPLPSNEELNALSLLMRFEPTIATEVAYVDLVFLRHAHELIKEDEFIRTQLGGPGLRNTLRLAGMIKAQFSTLTMQDRIRKVVPNVLGDLQSRAGLRRFNTFFEEQRQEGQQEVADAKAFYDLSAPKKNKNKINVSESTEFE